MKDVASANIQDKYSFWNDISEDRLWQNRKEKMLQAKEEYSLRPHQTRYTPTMIKKTAYLHLYFYIMTPLMIDILLILSCFLRVDMMIDEWQDNIKPFTKSTERNNDTKKLRENIRFKTTGINVDKLTSTSILFFYSLQ